jgi:hypothetical protein
VGKEVAEASDAIERIAQYEQCPALTDDLEGSGERAGLACVVPGKRHYSILPHFLFVQ